MLDRLPFGHQGIVAKATKAVFEEPFVLERTLLCAIQADGDRDQPAIIANCRGHQTIAGLFSVAGLKTVNARHTAEQQIAIGLSDAAIFEIALGEHVVVFGKILDQSASKRPEIARGHHMARDQASRWRS